MLKLLDHYTLPSKLHIKPNTEQSGIEGTSDEASSGNRRGEVRAQIVLQLNAHRSSEARTAMISRIELQVH